MKSVESYNLEIKKEANEWILKYYTPYIAEKPYKYAPILGSYYLFFNDVIIPPEGIFKNFKEKKLILQPGLSFSLDFFLFSKLNSIKDLDNLSEKIKKIKKITDEHSLDLLNMGIDVEGEYFSTFYNHDSSLKGISIGFYKLPTDVSELDKVFEVYDELILLNLKK